MELAPPAAMALPTALVVEDDGPVRETLVRMLRTMGFRTFEAADGRSAITKLDAIDALDLVLSDVVMPGGINGCGVARMVRALRPSTRVLLISGYSSACSEMDTAERRQQEILLRKPFSREQLARAIADAFEIPASA